MPQKLAIDNVDFLKKIIETQSMLAGSQFCPDEFMQLLANKVHEFTHATGSVIELLEGHFMVYRAVTGTVSDYQDLKLPVENSISGLCIMENRILISRDTEKDDRVNLEACRRVQARSLVVAPLVYSDEPVGVIKILSRNPDAFNELHIRILELMAGFMASGLKQRILFQEKENAIKKLKKTQKRLSYMAKHDFLTKLPNRKFFYMVLGHTMEKIKRKGGLIALMFLDIDHFKQINDNLGHATGDKLLVKFSQFLLKNVRKYDFVVRLGGDEFVILFDDLHEEKEATKIAEKLLNNLNETVFFRKIDLKIHSSMGISFYRGESLSPAELIKQADEALYRVKAEGRNGFRIFGQ